MITSLSTSYNHIMERPQQCDCIVCRTNSLNLGTLHFVVLTRGIYTYIPIPIYWNLSCADLQDEASACHYRPRGTFLACSHVLSSNMLLCCMCCASSCEITIESVCTVSGRMYAGTLCRPLICAHIKKYICAATLLHDLQQVRFITYNDSICLHGSCVVRPSSHVVQTCIEGLFVAG